MVEFVIELPFPPHALSPNARTNHYAKARVVKRCRSQAFLIVRETVPTLRLSHDRQYKVTIGYLFTPPDKRPRDEDNLLASMKPFADGIADALGINDVNFHYEEMFFTKPKRPGFVTADIKIDEVKND